MNAAQLKAYAKGFATLAAMLLAMKYVAIPAAKKFNVPGIKNINL